MINAEACLGHCENPKISIGRTLIAGALVLGACGGGESAKGLASDNKDEVVDLVATDFRFEWPVGTTFADGEDVTVRVMNEGDQPHDALFMSGHHAHDNETPEAMVIEPGETAQFSFEATDGSMIHCTIHPDMYTDVPVSE